MTHTFYKILSHTIISVALCTGFAACGGDDDEPPIKPETPEVPDDSGNDNDNDKPEVLLPFAKGADVSWLTQIEQEGYKFYNEAGTASDALAILREECGINSIRLRVWVNPEDGWNGLGDLLIKARRAHALGMRLMIDFHLSDTWADPSNQAVPADWKRLKPGEELANAVREHVTEVLTKLKENGITPEWVQIGNETSGGMLWESGRVQGSRVGEFVRYFNAGAEAVKKIAPEARVIMHLNNGHDRDLYLWFFNLMKANGAKYDIIGMSLYPENESGSGSSWQVSVDNSMVTSCINNIKYLSELYGKPVIISEIGFHHSNGEAGKKVIDRLLEDKSCKHLTGVFYWEPEAPEGFNNYHKGAFENGRPNEAIKAFRN